MACIQDSENRILCGGINRLYFNRIILKIYSPPVTKGIYNLGGSELEFLLVILIEPYDERELCTYIHTYLYMCGVDMFHKTSTVYSVSNVCHSNGFLELLLDEVKGEGVLGQIIVQVESP